MRAMAALGALAALAFAAAPSQAQGPAVPTVILGGHLYPRPFGLAYVYGHVELPLSQDQAGVANQTVQLYASPFPFTAWTPVATMTTDFGGYFSYHTMVSQNMGYRAIWQTSVPVQSKDKLLKVPLKLTLKASHSRVKKKGVVTFTGTDRPGHPGVPVELQQADRNGRYKTFARTVVSPASTFRSRVRVRRGGLFRVLFRGDGQFGIGVSRSVRVTVVKRHHHH